MEDFKDEALKLVDEFFELEIVKKYLKSKELYESDEELKEAKLEIRRLKKDIPVLEGKEREDLIASLKIKEDECDKNPHYVTYMNYKEEVYSLLRDLELIFK